MPLNRGNEPEAVAAGEKWIPKEIASRLASRKLFEDLTPRELQVLQQMAKGLANKEIGDILDISGHTVKDHLKNILGNFAWPIARKQLRSLFSAELFSCSSRSESG
jgi:DNA-binding CsgD family transcriptional regulator